MRNSCGLTAAAGLLLTAAACGSAAPTAQHPSQKVAARVLARTEHAGQAAKAARTRAPAYFRTLPPKAKLPSGAQCAKWVLARPLRENKGVNRRYNHTRGQHLGRNFFAREPLANRLIAARVNGDFTGTTQEILRWAACKWASTRTSSSPRLPWRAGGGRPPRATGKQAAARQAMPPEWTAGKACDRKAGESCRTGTRTSRPAGRESPSPPP